MIGQGGFGSVLEGIVNKEKVIIKCVDKNAGEKTFFFFKLSNVPGIVQYITHCSDKNYIYIVMRNYSTQVYFLCTRVYLCRYQEKKTKLEQ